MWAFMLLTLGINIIGIMSFFFYERQQRAAFLETRQSLETKLILEQESQEQVSYLFLFLFCFRFRFWSVIFSSICCSNLWMIDGFLP